MRIYVSIPTPSFLTNLVPVVNRLFPQGHFISLGFSAPRLADLVEKLARRSSVVPLTAGWLQSIALRCFSHMGRHAKSVERGAERDRAPKVGGWQKSQIVLDALRSRGRACGKV